MDLKAFFKNTSNNLSENIMGKQRAFIIKTVKYQKSTKQEVCNDKMRL